MLTDGQTQSLVQRGWEVSHHSSHDGFKNHGQYVSTMVHLAKELGHNGRVGALQANFLPADWYYWQDAYHDAVEAGVSEKVEEAEWELRNLMAEMDNWKPVEKEDEWAAFNLDVDGDGMITEDDLAAAEGGDKPPEFFWPDAGP